VYGDQYHKQIDVNGTQSSSMNGGTVLYLNYIGGAVGKTCFITVTNNTNTMMTLLAANGFSGTNPNHLDQYTIRVGGHVVFECGKDLTMFGFRGVHNATRAM
jgi:hypothetical protein